MKIIERVVNLGTYNMAHTHKANVDLAQCMIYFTLHQKHVLLSAVRHFHR